jgi:hypothetical protein
MFAASGMAGLQIRLPCAIKREGCVRNLGVLLHRPLRINFARGMAVNAGRLVESGDLVNAIEHYRSALAMVSDSTEPGAHDLRRHCRERILALGRTI